MLVERIVKVFTFQREVFHEVEQDESFTTTAWILVAVVAFLSQFGSSGGNILAGIFGTIAALIGFAVAAWLVSFIGRQLFNAEVTFGELVRTLGLAYVWNVVGVLGLLGAVSQAFTCITGTIGLIAGVLALVAWLLAAKEALDLDWGPTAVTVILAWIAMMAILFGVGALLATLGPAAGALGGDLRP
jgi:hypothetical protein